MMCERSYKVKQSHYICAKLVYFKITILELISVQNGLVINSIQDLVLKILKSLYILTLVVLGNKLRSLARWLLILSLRLLSASL